MFCFSGESCRRGCVEMDYNFTAPVSIFPSRDSLHVGDTLYIECKQSTTLYDSNGARNIDFSGAKNVGTVLGIGELNRSADSIRGAVSDFQWIPINGKFYSGPQPQRVKQVTL